MNDKTIKSCSFQLRELADSLDTAAEDDIDSLIMKTCISLIGIVDSNGCEKMEDTKFNTLKEQHMLLYGIMNSFMSSAERRIPLSEAETELIFASTRYDELKKQFDKAKAEKEQIINNINACEAETKALEAFSGGELKRYAELSDEHKRLLEIKKNFSPDKLTELEHEVAALREEGEYLSERHSIINDETSQALKELTTTLDKLGKTLTPCTKEVEKIKSEAESFATAIDMIVKIHKEYSAWFDSDRRPIDRLGDIVGTTEAENLRTAVDNESIKKNFALIRRIEDDLRELDRIVAACMNLSQSDYENIQKKSGKLG